MPKPDWMQMERRIRAALREYVCGELLATQACRIIDEAVAAGTLRGNVLPREPLEWENEADLRQINPTMDGFWEQAPQPATKDIDCERDGHSPTADGLCLYCDADCGP